MTVKNSNNGAAVKPESNKQLTSLVNELESNSSSQEDFGGDHYAAVDLGSNSFHLMISRYEHGEFTVVDRQREVVRLAGGLDDQNILSDEVSKRALACMRRFGQLIRSIPSQQIRVVGTNALRQMHNKAQFLDAAEQALGHNIEIIAGREEARLIYLGVSKWSVTDENSRLVIDIGGGSTEIIVGKGDKPLARESLDIGCVVLSNRFFRDGVLSRERFEQAQLSAELAIQPVVKLFREQGWAQAIGCSGTMKSLSNILIEGGWSKDGINRDALQNLLQNVISAQHVDKLSIAGLSGDRKPVFAGGLSILLALFEQFGLSEMSVSDIALREGVLYDLVGRSSHEDIRQVTIAAMLSRWAIQEAQGSQVRDTALYLYQCVAQSWDIQDNLYADILGWSAQLHELGLLISHDGYHKHGAYVVANADMAGFARRDQLLLSCLIAGHRRKFPLDQFEQLPSNLVTPAKRIAVILRLAVLIHRERAPSSLKIDNIEVVGQQINLRFEPGSLDKNPLTKADLNQEQSWLKVIGVKLNFQ